MEVAGRVLVTGGTGFIGGRLVERLMLEHDVDVRVLVRNPATAVRVARFPVEIVVGDLTDGGSVRDAVRGCDTVLHCAHDSSTARGHWASGYEGTHLLARACLDAGVSRMVHLSSFVVYGDTVDGDLTEEAPYRSASGRYTAAKRGGEELVLDLHRDAGLPVSVLQPTIVYGPFGEAWTRGVVESLRTGLVPLIDGGSGLCNAVYVDDVVDAILSAATVPEAVGERFLISADEPVTWERFFGAFEELLGSRSTISVSRDRLAALRRVERRRARRQVVELVSELARDAIRRPETLEAALDLRSVRAGVDVLMSVLPDRHWRSLKARVRGGGGGGPVTDGSRGRRKIHLPDDQQTALYSSRTRVRIDRAAEVLGYQPAFGFDAGMALTAEYLRWARLV